MDASVGDTIMLSYGAKNLTNPLVPDHRQIDLKIVKIINEEDLFGKANYNQQRTLFFELDELQQLLANSSQPVLYQLQGRIKEILDPNDIGDRLYECLPESK